MSSREPMLTLADLAREVDVQYKTLHKRFRESAPDIPVLFTAKRKKLYSAAALRKWHRNWVLGKVNSKAYAIKEAQLAIDFCPPINPCRDCGNPVIKGYCCTFCGSVDP